MCEALGIDIQKAKRHESFDLSCHRLATASGPFSRLQSHPLCLTFDVTEITPKVPIKADPKSWQLTVRGSHDACL